MKHPHTSLSVVLLLLLVVLLLASCTRHSAVWPQLLEAEQLLETDFNAAGAMLDSLDATSLEGEEAALYAILKTQADYKRYLPLTSDSLTRLATDYYGTPLRKNYHAAMAWYSLGCYYSEQKDNAGAIESYLHAKDLYPDTLVRYYALCEQNLGKHYYIHQMHDLSVPMLLLYKQHPATMTDSSMMADADYLLGIAYTRKRSFREAEQSFHAALDNPYIKENVRRDIYFYLAKILFYDEQSYGASLAFVDKNISMAKDGEGTGASWLLKGEILSSTNQLDSAYICYHRAIDLSHDLYTLCQAYKQLLNIDFISGRQDSLPQFGISEQSIERQQRGVFNVNVLDCFWFIIKEAICRKCRD
jgi:tetratricopeptide (TPR) repeat protein